MDNFINTLKEGFTEIFKNPLSLATLIGVVILILALIKFKKINLDAKIMSRIGIALALATILHLIKIVDLPNGAGSINLGSMVPILIIAFMYGPEIGMLTGFLFGVIYLIISPYILHPIQVLFDYPLPFMAVGLAGYFKNKKLLGTFVGMFVRFIFHFISGFLFFGQFAPEGWSPMIYSLVANGLVVGGNLIVVLIIIALLPINRIIKTSNNFTL
ncbi:energy-coupled thiamine transporter ThiT [Clostridium tertium]|jgi:thiamine transporter|uniref:Energy-coupled thiamine transporter ThiT n=3 Tax=Clostridium tertium TaxID=1559 RepID=A0A9X4B2G8_9CLOT|nr:MULTISPECIES: energy-coupled thiamine transporter ThiT [Clostridium]EEH98078.1 putative proton-coupled thiamine transporter YuaJ [Clostridium sp. 7_2_43FAA]MBP1867072.1 thiamine transporter [Clostridium tertium]MBS5305286.1 energy-coupled thiamine transporter ThiT [Clostridium sp.]MBS5883521.1 energy-coupled thiamine transporter ThiT [Clostridium sp.]MBU6135621.1 energy-coupled thiamine transporter ThiT [Clostridium tertium]